MHRTLCVFVLVCIVLQAYIQSTSAKSSKKSKSKAKDITCDTDAECPSSVECQKYKCKEAAAKSKKSKSKDKKCEAEAVNFIEVCPGSCPSETVNLTATSATQTLSNPGYFGYNNDLRCSWRILAPAGDTINITFIAFAIEFSYDDLSIIQGSSVVVYTGSTSPPAITTVSNEVGIIFDTDGSFTEVGFVLDYIIA